MLFPLCTYCQTDTAGNHQTGCPNAPIMSSEMFGRAGAGIEALAASDKIQRLEERARVFSRVFDFIYDEMESACGDWGAGEVSAEDLAERIYSWTERLAGPLDRLAEKSCHWNKGYLTDCGNPVIDELIDNDDINFCCYCGRQMEEWVTMS